MEDLQGQFVLNKMGWFTPVIVEENAWLNDKQTPADLVKFGKNYAVIFEGDAQTYLWTTKTPPEVGKKYWGHLQATSGKSIRFKTDKQEDAPRAEQNVSQGSYESLKEDSIARAVALKAAVEYVIGNGDPQLKVLETAETYLNWLKNDSGSPGYREVTLPQVTQVTQASQNPDSAVGQKRDWSQVGRPDPLPEPPEDINQGDFYEDIR